MPFYAYWEFPGRGNYSHKNKIRLCNHMICGFVGAAAALHIVLPSEKQRRVFILWAFEKVSRVPIFYHKKEICPRAE